MVRCARELQKLHVATDHLERERARQALASLLGDARGILMKVGQAAVECADDPLSALCNGVEPTPFEHVRARVEAELGRPIEEVFARFDPCGRAASIGQVHRATTHDGRDVAVKIQYPDIASAIEAELMLVGLIPAVDWGKRWGLDSDDCKGELRRNMGAELDYLDEAMRQIAFKNEVVVRGLMVPRVHSQLSTRRMLVQDFIDGMPRDEAQRLSRADRLEFGRIILETLFVSLFKHREVHCDPHVGNYRFLGSGDGAARVALFDFGCTLPIPARAASALLMLIRTRCAGRRVDAFSAFAEMGFDTEKLGFLGARLDALTNLLLEPFLTNRAFDVEDLDLGERARDLLGEERWYFRAAAPPELFLLLRAFGGVIAHLRALGASLPWTAILERSVADVAR